MLHVSLEAAWCMGKALAESLPNIYIYLLLTSCFTSLGSSAIKLKAVASIS